ncbi:MAG: hypothetical protein BWY71_02359 [Planctomycetes bacterium ADurb.Bin412]|nr:MAG: hypothetical protein BWY71_02359 [Planctomycetes bacterium ADurb.Bin412]
MGIVQNAAVAEEPHDRDIMNHQQTQQFPGRFDGTLLFVSQLRQEKRGKPPLASHETGPEVVHGQDFHVGFTPHQRRKRPLPFQEGVLISQNRYVHFCRHVRQHEGLAG